MPNLPLSQMAERFEQGQAAQQAALAAQAGAGTQQAQQAAAAQNQPAQAAQAQQAAPAGQTAAQASAQAALEITFRGEKVQLDQAEARRLAQIGMAASRLDEQRREFEAQRRANEEVTRVGQLMAQFSTTYPDRFRMVQDIMAGKMPTAPTGSGSGESDDDPLTDNAQGYRIPPEVQARLDRLEQAVQQTAQTSHQRDFDSRLEGVLGRQSYLSANPEAGSIARTMLGMARHTNGLVDLGDGQEPLPLEQAAVVLNQRLSRMAAADIERETRARESRRDTAPVRSLPDAAALPRLDKTKATYAAHKSGAGREMLRDWAKRLQSAMSGPPQT